MTAATLGRPQGAAAYPHPGESDGGAASAPTASPHAGPGPAADPAPAPPHTAPVTTAPSPSPAVAQALARLQASRQQLQRQLLPRDGDGASRGRDRAGFQGLRGLWAWWRHGRRRLLRLPGAASAVLVLGRWWQQQRWRRVAEHVAHDLVPPALSLVRRHPLTAVALAAGGGMALVALRPWRHRACRVHLARLRSHGTRALSDLALQLATELPWDRLAAGLARGARAPQPGDTTQRSA